VKVKQPGGVLEIMLGGALLLRGPAEISFSGEVEW
jgi:diaminopimelate epimerase